MHLNVACICIVMLNALYVLHIAVVLCMQQEELMSTFGIQFNSLFTITNMPIKRFADFLYRRGELKEYMDLLVRNFNPAAVKVLLDTL
jgi:Protein of unknown function (DUF3641)